MTLFKLLQFSIGMLAIAYLSACLYLFLEQKRFIFFPSTAIEITPADFNLVYQEVWLPVKNQGGKVERIHGWWIPGNGEKTLLYLHGNGINIGANVAHADRFHQLGFSVLLIDYRGYGRSEGNFPTETAVYQDAETAWNYLVKEKKIAAKQIFIYGHSLGGAIAIDLAVKYPDAAGVIVQSSFTSMRQMVDNMGYYRIFPSSLLLHQKFDSISKVAYLKIPVLFIHGVADEMIPDRMSQKLFAAAPEPKQLFLAPEAGHNDVAEITGEKYFQVIRDFLRLVNHQH